MAQDQTSHYVYDDDGRLRAVIAPSGEAAVYEYDAAGNFTAIRRLGADALELLTFAPRSGVVGTRVVFYGVGFGAGVSSVTFGGGAVGTLVGFTSNTITALVPEGAITGPVTIATARGLLTTATPFVVQGIVISPKESTVLEGEDLQFTATVIVPGDNKDISWSANGVEGGNDAVGRITGTGLYTAPLDQSPDLSVSIEAVSLAFPEITGVATVRVRSLADFLFTLSPGVSVGKGSNSAFGVFSPGVAIGKGNEFATVFSSRIAIGKGDNFTDAFSPGVSLGKGERFIYGAAISEGVSATKGPVVTAISPATVAQGTNVNMTISGANFGGANSVMVLNPDGNEAFGITTSNINVSADGSSLTVLLSVTTSASVGRKVAVVRSPTAHSVFSDVNMNAIQITAP